MSGTFKSFREGDGITAKQHIYIHIYRWYSAVTLVILAAKMNLVMNPGMSRNITQVALQLEQWSALVETLEKYGSAYSLSLPFRVIALGVIMRFAGDLVR